MRPPLKTLLEAVSDLNKRLITALRAPLLRYTVDTLLKEHKTALWRDVAENGPKMAPNCILNDLLKEQKLEKIRENGTAQPSYRTDSEPLSKNTLFGAFSDLGSALMDQNRLRSYLLKKEHMRPPTSSYNHFLRTLYSRKEELPSSVLENTQKYGKVNHEDLYSAYEMLPQPRPLHIQPQHLEDFVSLFMERRNFVKTNSLSGSMLLRSPKSILRAYKGQVLARKRYTYMVRHVLNDIKESGLPLSASELNKLLQMAFFRDRPDILQAVNSAYSLIDQDTQEGYEDLFRQNPFNWTIYQQILALMEHVEIGTLNVLLFHASRHAQEDVLRDILQKTGFEELQENVTQIVPADRETYCILLEHYTESGLLSEFTGVVERIKDLDIKTINLVISGLVKFKVVSLAEELAFLVASEEPENVHEYKNLSWEDRRSHQQLLQLYDRIGAIVREMPPFRVVADLGTFRPFIQHYCRDPQPGSFGKVTKLMDAMEYYSLPLGTQTFKSLLAAFLHQKSWTMDDLNYTTTRLLSVHDSLYGIRQDTVLRDKMDRLSLLPEVAAFLNEHLEEAKPSGVPIEKGNFLKLDDYLMESVYQAYLAKIEDEYRGAGRVEMLHYVESQRAEMFEEVKRYRGRVYAQSEASVTANDAVTYVKKAYLIELLGAME